MKEKRQIKMLWLPVNWFRSYDITLPRLTGVTTSSDLLLSGVTDMSAREVRFDQLHGVLERSDWTYFVLFIAVWPLDELRKATSNEPCLLSVSSNDPIPIGKRLRKPWYGILCKTERNNGIKFIMYTKQTLTLYYHCFCFYEKNLS